MERIQHRGINDHEGLPNSLEGVVRNYGKGVEADAVLLQDGTIAMFHERDVGLPLAQAEEMSGADLQALGIPTDKADLSGRAIPTLKEFMDLATDADSVINLELKASSVEKAKKLAEALSLQIFSSFSQDPSVNEKAKEYAENLELFLRDKVRFESMSVGALDILRAMAEKKGITIQTNLFWPSSSEYAEKNPTWDVRQLGLMEEDPSLSWAEQGIAVAAKTHCSRIEFFVPDSLITKEIVEKARQKGLEVGASLVGDKAHEEEWIKKFEEWGVDYVTTES